ncbi:MAG: phage holin family protein [Tomitella sp.]|nr:phage holin family protein [Tomitella sp.]
MSFTDRTTGNGAPGSLSSIPLSDLDPAVEEASIGTLVKNASGQVSTLVRSEVELAKAEVTAEVKKALQGSVFFIIAATILLFSTFFFFFFLGELLSEWLPRWAAFLIVFGIQVFVAAIAGLIGYLRVRKIRSPEKTIGSVKEIPTVLPTSGKSDDADDAPATTGASRPTAGAAAGGKHAR